MPLCRYVASVNQAKLLTMTTPQPRSQGLSSLPPLSLEKETLVAASHVNTQTLGGKKIFQKGRVTEFFNRYGDKFTKPG